MSLNPYSISVMAQFGNLFDFILPDRAATPRSHCNTENYFQVMTCREQ